MKWRLNGIRSTLLAASILPAVLVAVVLSGVFLHDRYQDLDEQLDRNGFSLARQLGAAAEFGVFTRNAQTLSALVQAVLREQDVAAVLIRDAAGQTLASAGGSPGEIEAIRAWQPGRRALPDSDKVLFVAPIAAAEVLADDPYTTLGFDPSFTGRPPALGVVAVELSLHRIKSEQAELFVAGVAVTLAGLVGAALLAIILSRQVINPVKHFAEAVDRIGRGEQGVRLHTRVRGELRQLEQGLNLMATRLDSAQSHMRREIELATGQLQLKKEEAERANLAKSRFLAAASHDLRQPMHAVNLLTAGLGARPHCEADRELIKTIESAAQAMSGLLDALLDMSRLDAGEMEVNLADFPVVELFEQIRDAGSAIARDKGVTLRIVPSSRWLRSDPVLLQRIVLNLVSNALRYTREGAVLVGCRARGGMVRIEVRDSGIGIPREAHELIFEEFVQLANPERDRSKGLGLGLAIVQRLSRILGHRISLRSSPGRGSVFAIDVPPGTDRAADRRDEEIERRRPVLLSGRTVLIIEDDALSRAGMVTLIESWGCTVIGGASGESAIAECAAAKATPEAVISDFRLAGPDDNGIAAITQVRRRFGADIPAALVTGDTAAEVAALARDAGLLVLTKPVPPARLRAVLSRMLSRHEG